ncbi:MAG: leucine-rich repeat protein, partial [Clostridia bacterium]|nr:leucine-rich repeat protein [Clostridia bacterium]
MKGKLKKLTAVILSIALLGSAGIFTGLNAFAAAPETYTEISNGQTINAELDNNQTKVYFKFVPTQSGKYRFYSSSSDANSYKTDPYGGLDDANGNRITGNDDGGNGYNFDFTYTLEANKTYYFWAYNRSGRHDTEIIPVTLVHGHFDNNNDGKCDFEGCGVKFLYTIKEDEPIQVTISAGDQIQLDFTCLRTGGYRLLLDYKSSGSSNELNWSVFDSSGNTVYSDMTQGNTYSYVVFSSSAGSITATATVRHYHVDANNDGYCDIESCKKMMSCTLTEDVPVEFSLDPGDSFIAYFTPDRTTDFVFDTGRSGYSFSVHRNDNGQYVSSSYSNFGYNAGKSICSMEHDVTYRIDFYGSYYSSSAASYTATVSHAHYTDGSEALVVEPTAAAYGAKSMVCSKCGETCYALADPTGFYAGSGEQDGFAYNIYKDSQGNPEAVIYAYTGEETEVVFPSEVDGVPVTALGNTSLYSSSYGIFAANSNITSVVIPDGVQAIAPNAFAGLTGLEQVSIPDSVVVIGDQAFLYCINLATITMGDGVEYVGRDAFYLAPSQEDKESYGASPAGYFDYYLGYIEYEINNVLENQNYEFETMSSDFGTEITSWDDAYAFIDGATDEQIEAIYGTGATKADAKAQIDSSKAGFDSELLSLNIEKQFYENYPSAMETILAADSESPLERVMYAGSEDDWAAIIMADGNDQLGEAPRSYNGEGIYFATFMADGKEVAKVTFAQGQTSIAEPAVPAKDGYTGKWEAYTLNNADITINAVYTKEEVTYTVTFIADGKTVKTYKLAAGAKITTPPAPAKAGYTFKGWSPKVPAKMPAKNMTFKAVFESAAKVTFEKSASVAFRTKVTITATGENLPKGTVLAIYEKGGNKPLAKGSAKSVSYEAGEMKSAKTYEVRVIDSKGNAQKGLGGEIKIDVTGTGFFQRIIAFF